jgi:hypothetical protein
MGLIKKIGVIILSILLITTLTIFVLLIGFHEILQKETYVSSFQKNNFYSYIEKILIDLKIKDYLILDMTFEVFINNKVDNFLSYIKGNTNDLNLKIKINNSKMIDRLTENYENMPECNINNIQNKNLECRVPGVSAKDFVNEMLVSQNINIEGESSFDLKEIIDQNNRLSGLREYYRYYLIALYGSLLVSLVLLLGILILNLFNLKKSFRSIGMIILIVGINSLVFSTVFMNALINQGNQMMLEKNDPASMIFFNVFNDIMLTVGTKIKLIGIASLVAGIILIISSFLIIPIFKEKKDRIKK